jgi:hypothetical protein
MTYSLSFLPEVEDDVIAGYAWYEEKADGLGEEFLRLFYALSRDIPRNPLVYRTVYKDFRRRLLRRFPYAVYFRIEDDNVVIFGLFHCARDPRLIQDSLEARGT